jgi:UDP-N-acetylmuramate--alanine ligase
MASQSVLLDNDLKLRFQSILKFIPETYLSVNIQLQELYLVKKQMIQLKFPVSTSKYGIGNLENSYKTPLGIHSIVSKIGRGVPAGRIFIDRIDTGRTWKPGMQEDNLILTRILRLKGLEPGINAGKNIDSFERYIYIHGTGKEDRIGTPISHGCICMRNNDIIKLFDSVKENTIVIINKG